MMQKALIAAFFVLPSLAQALPAFPGAQGAGASTAGGRDANATVYVVDTLSDNPEDGVTFREACEASGPRYITFAVSGVIWLNRRLTIENHQLTVAGQTSPGGICLAGYMVVLNGVHDVVMTHMRFRVGPLYETASGPGYAALSIMGGSALGGADDKSSQGTDPSYNIVFDHCSFSWANDTNINIGYDTYDIVFSWCSIVEPLYAAGHEDGNSHNLGMLWWGRYNSMANAGGTVHHSVFIDNYYRVPEVNYASGVVTQVNNVSYGTGTTQAPGFVPVNDGGTLKVPYINYIGNYNDVRGANSSTAARNALGTITGISPYEGVYMSGCVQSNLGASTPAWNVGNYDDNWGANLLPTAWQKPTAFTMRDIAVTSTPMNDAYAAEIVANAGANRVQSTTDLTFDAVDLACQEKYANNTGAWKHASTLDAQDDWPTFLTPTPPADTDSDGISDVWEQSTFGSLEQNQNTDHDGDGYSDLEEYLHELAGYTDAAVTITNTTPQNMSCH